MAVYELKNECISIAVHSHGAELKSLKKVNTGMEYMWCGDAAYWGRTSPVLFPFVGGLKNKQYRTKGKAYPMTQHGFARDMEFTPLFQSVLSQSANELWFELRSNAETMEKYPYAFVLKIGYRIEGNRVDVMWQVENTSMEDLPFSIGGHPAFNCPIAPGTQQNEYSVDFGDIEKVVSTRIGTDGLATPLRDIYSLEGGKLALNEHLFDNDALVIEGNQTKEVSLCRNDGTKYLTVTMNAPLFGIWSPPGKNAPFVCIEPWYGRCDSTYFCGVLEEREWENILEPGGVWNASYTIEVLPS